MRRMTTLILIAASGAVLALATVSALLHGPCRGPVTPVARSLERLLLASAAAQEAMQFKPVPAESVMERPAPRARVSRAAATPAPMGVAPALPAPPVPPAAVGPERDFHDRRSGDVVRFGSDIHVSAAQSIAGDVVAIGGDVSVDGHVDGDVVAIGGDLNLGPAGDVDGDVVTIGGQLREEPGSRVGGQRVSAGRVGKRMFGAPFLGFMGLVGSGVKAGMTVAKMIVFLLIAWGFTQLAPKRTQAAFDAFKREPLMCFAIGLLAWALIIPSIVALALVVAILCITIIGIPLALAVILGYVLALLLLIIWGYVVGAAVFGERLASQLGRNARSLTLMAVWGIVALSVIRVVGHLFGAIPMGGMAGGLLVFLSKVIGGVLFTIGAGALLRTQWRRDVLGQWWPGTPAVATGPAPSPTAPAPESAPVTPAPSGDPPAPPSPELT